MGILNTEIKNHIIKVSIYREQAGNSVNFKLMDELEKLLDEIELNEEIRVMILTGSGRFFVSGGDLKEFHNYTSEDEGRMMAVRMQEILLRLEKAPFFTIAAVNGLAYGGGWEITLAFDFAVAKKSAKLGFIQGRFYLPPGWGGLTRLVEKTGTSKAMELLAERKIISADEAEALGLLNQVWEDEDFEKKLDEFAQKISQNDRRYISNLKLHTRAALHNERLVNMSAETDSFAQFWADENHIRLVEAFIKENLS